MPITIFQRSKPKIAFYEIDAVLEGNTEKRTTVTYLPLQEGARAADHRIVEPIKVRMTGAISNNPIKTLSETLEPENLIRLGAGAAVGAIAGAISNPLVTAAAGVALGYLAGQNKESRALNAWTVLSGIQAYDEPFTIVTALGEVLENMVIERLYQETNPDNEDALIFVCEMVEFQYIRLGTGRAASETPAPVSAVGSGDQGPPTSNSQIQNTEGAATLASPAVTNQQVNAATPAQAVN